MQFLQHEHGHGILGSVREVHVHAHEVRVRGREVHVRVHGVPHGNARVAHVNVHDDHGRDHEFREMEVESEKYFPTFADK